MKNDRERILLAFESGDLGWDHALALLRKCPPSWQSPQWKKKREEVLGDTCESCGAFTPPLLIQHTWHPSSFRDLCNTVKPAIRELYERDNPFIPPDHPPFNPALVPPPETVERDSCPKCGSVNVKFRKSAGNWVCKYVKKRWSKPDIICAHEFDTPKRILWSKWTHEEIIAQARHRHEDQGEWARQEWENRFTETCREQICNEAMKLVCEEDRRYRALLPQDIKTLCKKCAFIEDIPLIFPWRAL